MYNIVAMTKNKKFIKFAILALLIFYIFYGFVFISTINMVLALIVGISLFCSLFYFFKNNKNLLILLILLSFTFSWIIVKAVKEKTQINNCFVFNQSYPGTTTFYNCVNNLKFTDYLFGLVSK